MAGIGTLTLLAAIGLFASSRPAHSVGGPVAVMVADTVPIQDIDSVLCHQQRVYHSSRKAAGD